MEREIPEHPVFVEIPDKCPVPEEIDYIILSLKGVQTTAVWCTGRQRGNEICNQCELGKHFVIFSRST